MLLAPVLQKAFDTGGRITRPGYYNPFGTSGVIPRRGFDAATAAFLRDGRSNQNRAWLTWSQTAPLVVLAALVETHEIASAALKHDLAECFGPDDTRFEAVEIVTASDGKTSEQVSSEGTDAINALVESLPDDTGGLFGLQWTLGEQGAVAGMGCLEAVPSENPSEGLSEMLTYAPLSVRFRDTERGRIAEQGQYGGLSGGTGPNGGEFVELPKERCFNVPWRGSRDNPYGIPHYGPFHGVGLADLGEQKDLRDWLHTIAWPRLAVTFPYDKVVQYARENPTVLIGQASGGGDITETQYAAMQFRLFTERIETMKSDDTLMLPMGAEAKGINMATATGLSDIYEKRIQRICNALDILPGSLGYTFGGTQAYSKEQTRNQAKKLEARRAWVNAILIRGFNLHLRLLGMPMKARAVTEPMIPSDRLSDAQSQAIEIENQFKLVDRGYRTDEDAAMELTGSGVVDKVRAANYRAPANPGPTPNIPA